jgi:N-acetylmuramate 1-kinase
MTDNDAVIRQYVRDVLKSAETASVEITPLAKGGSDRIFRRIRCGNAPSVIFMHYNPDREENRYYADIANFLRELAVAVPRILHHDPDRCFILMEDLGDADLWSFRSASWFVRGDYYRKVLRMIHSLHAFPLDKLKQCNLTLMAGFGPALYRWERDYFREDFVRGVCAIELDALDAAALEDELEALAIRLEQGGDCLIHRDLQSQNVLICKGEPVFIDFQGLRPGSPFYDLGSLLYDPYVVIDERERLELLRYYYELGEQGRAWETFQEMFREAAVQRLLQALGAYGFLGRQPGRQAFMAHIPRGLAHLAEVTARSPKLPLIRNLVDRCRKAL